MNFKKRSRLAVFFGVAISEESCYGEITYMFTVFNTKGAARRGELETRKGKIQTPCFMPIATKGAIKTLSADEIRALDPDVILGNTYHLMLRPGSEEIKRLGGMHQFMDWHKSILTDSGGFQVFSLANIRKITREGVRFNSHIDGKEYFLTPEESMRVQLNIGSDIMMVLDECVELPASRDYLEQSIDLTAEWAGKCKVFFSSTALEPKPLLFGIVQGGTDKELREKSAKQITDIGFDGYALGGLAVGESEQEMYSVLDYATGFLPSDRPRYLMGVGYPHQIVEAVKRGVDMFDCVIPTREARHGRLYGFKGETESISNASADFYQKINIKNEEYKFDMSPINATSRFVALRTYSKAYLRHLFVVEDPLAPRLATLNNLEFYLELMNKIRREIESK